MNKCCDFIDMKRRKFNESCWNIKGLLSYIIIISLIINKASSQQSQQSFGITLDCTFRMSSIPWPILGEIYECYIENDLFVTHAKMPVKDAAGEHRAWKNDNKVIGFYARSAEVYYFPNGLAKIFPNLRLIAIAMSNLREIKQVNLIPFDQLQYLCLFDNQIETIEKHLFAHNLMLEAIDLRENRITRIYVNVFDYLINLRILYMSDAFNSSCVSADANDRNGVVKLINAIKEDCNERAIWRLVQSVRGAAKSVPTTFIVVQPTNATEIQGEIVEEKKEEEFRDVDENQVEVTSGGGRYFGFLGLLLLALATCSKV